GFLTSDDLVRGVKVHVTAVDPLATPRVADTIDIETAGYSGRISAVNTSGFTYTRQFARATDDYTVTLAYISASSANVDPSGTSVMGFLWWDFTYPTLAIEGSGAVQQFVDATNAGVNFGVTAQSATPIYRIDRWNGVMSITRVDSTTASGLATVSAELVAGTPVKVYGVPQPDGTLKAYVLAYFTGTLPSA